MVEYIIKGGGEVYLNLFIKEFLLNDDGIVSGFFIRGLEVVEDRVISVDVYVLVMFVDFLKVMLLLFW